MNIQTGNHVSWNVRRLLMKGEKRHAILLHHARESGLMAGMCMDYYLEQKAGMRSVNIAMVKRAVKEMKKLERVSRLMYRAGYLTHEGLGKIITTNQQNMKELKANVNPDIMELFCEE